MEQDNLKQTTHRRGFLGALAAGAAAIGLASVATPFNLQAQANKKETKKAAPASADPAVAWINKIKGKHRIVFDATQPHEIMPFAWPKVFILTNGKTGVPANECGVVVVLRHSAIAYAFESKVWEKFNFGELFSVPDPHDHSGKTIAKGNPFWMPNPKFTVPGLGEVAIGINDLQADGVMFCVCDAAMTVYSTIAGEKMQMKPEEVKKIWLAGLLPGIQVVPSGVWALGRAQENGCNYIFAG